MRWTKLVLLAMAIVVALAATEVILRLRSGDGPARPSQEWLGTVAQHPELGTVYHPYSVLKGYYPDNPRGYFEQEDARARKWQLRVGGGAKASLELPADRDSLRIAIGTAAGAPAYDVQLNQPGFTIAAARYRLTFRARADQPREIAFGLSKAHAPWDGLGFYRTLAIGPDGVDFSEEFAAGAADENARVHFDLGGSDVSVDLSAVKLTRLSDGVVMEPPTDARRYFVSYRYNALGCRGPDYAIPKPSSMIRVVLLGDSYGMGMGVHETDTVAAQLASRLNRAGASVTPPETYEVINCANSGYDTRQAVMFHRLVSSKYQPDLVLIAMVWNDDMSYVDELRRGAIERRRDGLESVSRVWSLVQDIRHRRPSLSFENAVEQVRLLDTDVRVAGARLGVMIFRNGCDDHGPASTRERSDELAREVTAGLQGSGTPVLDLRTPTDYVFRGRTLCTAFTYDDLLVHEIDAHPNDIVHAVAAERLDDFIRRERLLRRR